MICTLGRVCTVLHLALKFYTQKYPSDKERGEIIHTEYNHVSLSITPRSGVKKRDIHGHLSLLPSFL